MNPSEMGQPWAITQAGPPAENSPIFKLSLVRPPIPPPNTNQLIALKNHLYIYGHGLKYSIIKRKKNSFLPAIWFDKNIQEHKSKSWTKIRNDRIT
jgi:hypothetical protein